MPLDDAAKIWSLNYRLLLSVIASVEADISELGLDSKELFLLAEVDEHPYPAELAATTSSSPAFEGAVAVTDGDDISVLS